MDRNRIRNRLGASALLAALALLACWQPLAAAAPGLAKGEVVDINTADVQELTRLPGVGEAIARRIVAHREEHGAFRRVEDLLKVKGIGEKSLEKLRPHVKVSGSR